jgi:hypothetical protein
MFNREKGNRMNKSVANFTHSISTSNQPKNDFHSSDSIVSDESVSISFLQDLLAKYKVEAVIDEDGELEVGEGFGPLVFIRIEPHRHWIVFHTGFSTLTLDAEERRDFADYLNNNLSMGQFAATDSGIGMGYFMYYRGGLNVDQFMAMAQRFGSLACTAMKRLSGFISNSDQQDDIDSSSISLN